MSLINQLTQQLSGPALEALSGQLGADQQSTSNAINAALPMLVGQLAKQSQGGNTNGILSMIDADGDGNIMEDLVGFLGTTENGPAQSILSNLFGGNQGNMENGVSKMSGLNNQQSAQLMANLAPIVMGFLSKQKQQSGMDESGLADMLNQEREEMNNVAKENPMMDMAARFLDADGDGNVMDDIGGMLGGLFGGK